MISWKDYFINLAQLTSMRSKDPKTKVGCVIVNKKNRIISLGYNGFPDGIKDSQLPWTKHSNNIEDTKYPYVIHAEENCILHAPIFDLSECTIYTTHYPCHKCARAIIQKGIRRVVFINHKEDKATEKMFRLVGVEVEHYSNDDDFFRIRIGYSHKQTEYLLVIVFVVLLQSLYIAYLRSLI